MIWSCKPLTTFNASKSLFSGMCSQVSLKFIRPGKRFVAEHPTANKRSVSGMPSQMRFQVGRFPVDLPAPWNMTDMLSLLFSVSCTRPVLTVRTFTFSAASRNHALGVFKQCSSNLSIMSCGWYRSRDWRRRIWRRFSSRLPEVGWILMRVSGPVVPPRWVGRGISGAIWRGASRRRKGRRLGRINRGRIRLKLCGRCHG